MLIPFWAIFLSGLLSFGVGALWYGPFFGKRWTEAVGLGLEHGKMEVHVLGITLFFWVVSAFVYNYIIQLADLGGVIFPFCLAFGIWFGFVFPVRVLSVLYGRLPKSLIWLDGLYYLVGYMVLALMHLAFVGM